MFDGKLINLKVEDILQNGEAPLRRADEYGLKKLSDSIRENGILQPLVVRKAKNSESENATTKLLGDKYTIISGERRWRAAKIAGLTEVPVVIKDLSDADVAAVSLA